MVLASRNVSNVFFVFQTIPDKGLLLDMQVFGMTMMMMKMNMMVT